MFNCSVCKESVGPGISPIHVVTGTRAISYHNEFEREDEWGNKELVKVDSVGTEITGEALVCPPCAKVEAPTGSATTVKGAYSFQEKQADQFKVKLIAGAIASALSRIEHSSKRAKHDVEIVVPQIKEYVDTHKDLVF